MIGESDVGRSLLIAFSDGVDTSSWLAADAVLETARRSDVVMYGVSADAGGQTFLKDLARATGGSLFVARQTDDLRIRLRQCARGVPPALPGELLAARSPERRLAPHRRAGQGPRSNGQGAPPATSPVSSASSAGRRVPSVPTAGRLSTGTILGLMRWPFSRTSACRLHAVVSSCGLAVPFKRL